ncbi:CAP domain-containing protein [Yoonia sp. MH D7]
MPTVASAPTAVLATSTVAPTTTSPTAPTTTSLAGLLNGARAGEGAGSVVYDSRLGQAAQVHADDMLANGYFSHTGLDGSDAGDRIRAAGYVPRTWGENIARGQQSEAEVFEAWQDSPGHRENNLNPNFEDFALSKAGSGSDLYWVLVFASEQ